MNVKSIVFCFVLLICAGIQKTAAQQLWKTNPKECVLLNDTLNTTMTMVTLAPGESLAPHTHDAFLLYMIEGGTLENTTNGKATRFDLPTGFHMQSAAMGQHSDKNVGAGTVQFLIIEMKKTVQ